MSIRRWWVPRSGSPGGWLALGPGAIGGEVPGLAVVGEHDLEDFHKAGLKGGVFDGGGGLDAVREIAVHPVAGAHEHFGLAVVVEAEDPRVFEEAADDRRDADIFRQPRQARPQAAEAADD